MTPPQRRAQGAVLALSIVATEAMDPKMSCHFSTLLTTLLAVSSVTEVKLWKSIVECPQRLSAPKNDIFQPIQLF